MNRLSIAGCVAAATLALSGCVSDYAYRDGPGDYYYGQPTVDYNYYGAPYGGAGYGGYGYGSYGYGGGYYGGYGYPYGYGGSTYVYPRYYYRDRDRDHRPDRPGGNNGGSADNRNDRMRGILERNARNQRNDGQARNDDAGRLRYRSPDPQGQRYGTQQQGLRMPMPQNNGQRPREVMQSRQLQRSAPQQQMRAPQQQMRSAPVQRVAPAGGRVQSGRDGGGRTSEP